jgi:uncharacterized protein (TIGR02099 family)
MKTRLLKSLLGLCAASILLVLLGAAFLYGWVVPNMDTLRPRIEAYLSEQVGHTVQIQNITAESTGLLPSFDVRGVRILDASEKPALILGRVQVSFSPVSLLTFHINRLTINAPQLEVTRDIAGKLTIAGFPITAQAQSGKGLDWLFSQKEIVIKGGTLHWLDLQPHLIGMSSALPEATFTNVSITFKNGIRSHDVQLEATPPAAFGRAFQATGKFIQPLLETHAGHWQAWSGSLSAKTEDIPELAKQLTAELVLPARTLVATGTQIQLNALTPVAKMFGLQLPLSPAQNAALDGRIEHLTVHVLNVTQPMDHIRMQATLAKPDVQGDIDVTWRAQGEKATDGLLEAKGNLVKLDLAALHRYLPESMAATLQPLLQSSLRQGTVKDATFTIKGSPKDFPFTNAKTGELRAQGKIADGHFVWGTAPALTRAQGTFDLNGAQLRLSDVRTVVANLPVSGAMLISDLRKPVLEIDVGAKGAVSNWLELMNTAALKPLTNGALASSEGTGLVDAQCHLRLPIDDLAQRKISGSVQFLDASLKLNSQTPPLTHLKGKLIFDETVHPAIQLQNLRGVLLGGDIQLGGNSQRITGTGTVSAEAIKAWRGFSHLAGATPYRFTLDLQGNTGLAIESSLVGMQLDLPAPLKKSAATAWPLRYTQRKTLPTQDHISLTLANVLGAEFIRDTSGRKTGDAAKVLRGNFAIGVGSTATLPELGVSAHLKLDELDADAWRSILLPSSTGAGTATPDNVWTSYLPTQFAAEIGTIKIGNRSFERVAVGASKMGGAWHINADAKDFSGYVEYRSGANTQAGQLYARLERLSIPDTSSKSQIEQLLANAAPSTLPALDLVVEEFALLGKKIGRLEVNAVNQRAKGYLRTGAAQEWRLQKLNITNPDSELKATGVWTPSDKADARRVDLQFNLDIADSGAMLTRMGQPRTIKDGKGNLQGRIAWIGSPLAWHYPTLTGEIKLNIAKGQFLKIEPGSGGRFMSVLSLQALPRLLTLDFRDVFSDGFAFDSVTGDAQITEGVLRSNNLQMKSVLALVSLDGTVDLAKETQHLHVLVLPDINAGGVSLLATLINPVVGAVTYLTQLVLRRPVVAAATKEFTIEGSWRDPKVVQIKKK